MIAVIADTRYHFRKWCERRGIRMRKDGKILDVDGEQIHCVITKENTRGMRFDSIEDISYSDSDQVREALEEAKKRVY